MTRQEELESALKIVFTTILDIDRQSGEAKKAQSLPENKDKEQKRAQLKKVIKSLNFDDTACQSVLENLGFLATEDSDIPQTYEAEEKTKDGKGLQHVDVSTPMSAEQSDSEDVVSEESVEMDQCFHCEEQFPIDDMQEIIQADTKGVAEYLCDDCAENLRPCIECEKDFVPSPDDEERCDSCDEARYKILEAMEIVTRGAAWRQPGENEFRRRNIMRNIKKNCIDCIRNLVTSWLEWWKYLAEKHSVLNGIPQFRVMTADKLLI